MCKIQFLCIQRPTFKQRQSGYSDLGLLIRCVRPDEMAATNVLHYLEDGTATMEFLIGNGIFLMPGFYYFLVSFFLFFSHKKPKQNVFVVCFIFFVTVILLMRALKQTSDREIYNAILQGTEKDVFLSERVELMLRRSKALDVMYTFFYFYFYFFCGNPTMTKHN